MILIFLVGVIVTGMAIVLAMTWLIVDRDQVWSIARTTAVGIIRYRRKWADIRRWAKRCSPRAVAERKAVRRLVGQDVQPTHALRRIHWLRRYDLQRLRQARYRGDVLRLVTTYRLKSEGEWQSVSRVHEPETGQSYWLAGDPEEDPRLEGFLLDRRAMPHLAMV